METLPSRGWERMPPARAPAWDTAPLRDSHVPHRLRPQSETTAFEFVRSHKSFPQRPCLWLKQTSIFADNSKVSFLERTMETSWEFENTETPKKMADTDILTVRRDHSGRVSLFTPGHFGLGGDLRSDMSPKSIL